MRLHCRNCSSEEACELGHRLFEGPSSDTRSSYVIARLFYETLKTRLKDYPVEVLPAPSLDDPEENVDVSVASDYFCACIVVNAESVFFTDTVPFDLADPDFDPVKFTKEVYELTVKFYDS